MTKKQKKNSKPIDLKPIDGLNKKLELMLKMPSNFYHQIIESPQISEEVQKELRVAADHLLKKNYLSAIYYYKKILTTVKPKKNEENIFHIILNYLLVRALIESKKISYLIEAKEILDQLKQNHGEKYPVILYIFSDFYLKVCCFTEAEEIIKLAISILNNDQIEFNEFYIPGINTLIVESTKKDLSSKLMKLKEQCESWHKPDAICFMKNCKQNNLSYFANDKIFFKSLTFDGMVKTTCDNSNPCRNYFHKSCWEKKKKEMSPKKKITDEEILKTWDCFSLNCKNNNVKCKIFKIEIYQDEKTVRTVELPYDQKVQSKGAIHKEKIIEKSLIDVKNNMKCLEEPANSKTEIDWRPDQNYFGNKQLFESLRAEFYESFNFPEREIINYFNDFLVDFNKPVSCDLIKSKWEEDKDIIGWDDSIFAKFNCVNIIEFLLQSPSIVVCSNYMCNARFMRKAYTDLEASICGPIKFLMNEANDVDTVDSVGLDPIPKMIYNEELKEKDEVDHVTASLSTVLEKANEFVNGEDLKRQLDEDKIEKLFINDEMKRNLPLMETLKEEKQLERCVSNSKMIEIDLFEKKTEKEYVEKGKNDSLELKKAQELLECAKNEIFLLKKELSDVKNELNMKTAEMKEIKRTVLNQMVSDSYQIHKMKIDHQIYDVQKEYSIILKIQANMFNLIGKSLSVFANDWLLPMETLKLMNVNLTTEYYKRCELIQNGVCDIAIIQFPQTTLPNSPHNILQLIDSTFYMIQNHMRYNYNQPACQPFPPPLGYPNQFNYPKFAPTWNGTADQSKKSNGYQANHQQKNNFNKKNISTKDIKNEVNKTENKQPNAEVKNNVSNGVLKEEVKQPVTQAKSNFSNEISKTEEKLSVTQAKSSKIEGKKLNAEIKDNVSVELFKEEKQQPMTQVEMNKKAETVSQMNEKSSKELAPEESIYSDQEVRNYSPEISPQEPISSLDKLMAILRVRNKGVCQYDLLISVKNVRRKHGNSLSNLRLSEIIEEVEQVLKDREKLQIVSYDKLVEPKIMPSRNVPINEENNIPAVVEDKEQEKPKKKSWANQKSNFGWVKENEETECVICMELLPIDAKDKCTLTCRHSFHKKCIQIWFQQNRSCPSCRNFSSCEDDYPALP